MFTIQCYKVFICNKYFNFSYLPYYIEMFLSKRISEWTAHYGTLSHCAAEPIPSSEIVLLKTIYHAYTFVLWWMLCIQNRCARPEILIVVDNNIFFRLDALYFYHSLPASKKVYYLLKLFHAFLINWLKWYSSLGADEAKRAYNCSYCCDVENFVTFLSEIYSV